MVENILKTGTTTVALVCKDGLVMAADKRMTAGNLISRGKVEKVHKISDKIVVTIAGSVSDIQLLLKVIKAQISLDQLRRHKDMKVNEAANLLASLVYRNIRTPSMILGVTHFIFGGKDNEGFHLFDIYPDGTITEYDDYNASGSGSPFAIGVLESKYKHNISVHEGVKLVVEAINAALRRDSASGDGIDVITVTNDGIKKVLTKELNEKLTV